MTKHLAWLLLAIATALAAHADPAPDAHADPAPDETKRDAVALRAIDEHWGRAETDGDVAYLSQLLAPEYRSIGVTGESTTRAALLDHAAKHATDAARAKARNATQAFLAKHPTEMSVTVRGSVGVVSFFNPKRGADHAVRGADVFVYEDNRWHAVISLHNSAD